MRSYQFPMTAMPNGKVNTPKLRVELTLTSIEAKDAYLFKGLLYIDTDVELTAAQLQELSLALAEHDGEISQVSKVKQLERRFMIETMVEQAIYHPGLDTDQVGAYLSSIDDEINCWCTSGIISVMENKVRSDKDISSFKDFLLSPVNTNGTPFWIYLLHGIGSTNLA